MVRELLSFKPSRYHVMRVLARYLYEMADAMIEADSLPAFIAPWQ